MNPMNPPIDSPLRVLVVTAVPAERDAVLRGLGGSGRFEAIAAGVGPVASAIGTAKALAAGDYGLVVIAGIAGGFAAEAPLGSLVVASEIVAADLGAETPDGFCSLDELGFGTARVPVDEGRAARLAEALKGSARAVCFGPILTVSTVTGTAATADKLAALYPGAAAEGMEGFGAASAARDRGVPVLELRAISNPVGPRDRGAWRIGDALQALEAAGPVLLEVLR
ncbi:futalosine hydrolase [Paenibacillus filicis]|uniref:Futalosine hydrolase n=1 Tax=Paenibacillus gyeongsangnamensis TaxID=3388067 RepID=A0ABT4QFX3_9BACL|nr:futalosine hydrolase [Paenibacillus filicis]MCZ8515762.1 futalosine hydrolase [Paenibacillus filicis]